jgi:hypothetical protein
MMEIRWQRVVVVLLLGVACGACGNPEPHSSDRAGLNELIDGVVLEYGGLERLSEVRGYRMKGKLHAVQRGQEVETERWFLRPDQLRVELYYPDHAEIRVTRGVEAWVGQGHGEFAPARPPMVQSMRLQTLRLDFPVALSSRRREVQDMGIDDAGRRQLRLQIDGELAMIWHVDLGTKRVPKVTMQMVGPPAMTFSAEYEALHFVEGVLVAFRERTFSGTVQTSEFQATDFEINPPGLETMLQVPPEI